MPGAIKQFSSYSPAVGRPAWREDELGDFDACRPCRQKLVRSLFLQSDSRELAFARFGMKATCWKPIPQNILFFLSGT